MLLKTSIFLEVLGKVQSLELHATYDTGNTTDNYNKT